MYEYFPLKLSTLPTYATVNIPVCCEHNLYFLWDRFKHIGDSRFLEIVTTSKEMMSFHDHGVVVFWFSPLLEC